MTIKQIRDKTNTKDPIQFNRLAGESQWRWCTDLHPSQRENTVELELSRLDWSRVHQSVVELKHTEKKKNKETINTSEVSGRLDQIRSERQQWEVTATKLDFSCSPGRTSAAAWPFWRVSWECPASETPAQRQHQASRRIERISSYHIIISNNNLSFIVFIVLPCNSPCLAAQSHGAQWGCTECASASGSCPNKQSATTLDVSEAWTCNLEAPTLWNQASPLVSWCR